MTRIAAAALAAASCWAVFVHSRASGQSAGTDASRATAVAKARQIAQNFELNARILTIFNRDGVPLTTVGVRDLYTMPALSPGSKRIALIRIDHEKDTQDLWIVDVLDGRRTPVTVSEPHGRVLDPVWSPEGDEVAYVAVRNGVSGLYRNRINDSHGERFVCQLPGPATVSDWAMDGRHLILVRSSFSASVVYSVSLDAAEGQTPAEIFSTKSHLVGARLSPNNRFLAYISNESGHSEVYVRKFDFREMKVGPDPAWKVSDEGAAGMVSWSTTGKELYYLATDRSIMTVPVNTETSFDSGKPGLMFRQPESFAAGPNAVSIAPDGERTVIAVPKSQFRLVTIFDRHGQVLRTVGEPGYYVQPEMSPDGTRVAVMRQDPKTGNQDIWAFDITTGKGYAVTDDAFPENAPIWSADSKHLLYVSTRQYYAGVYRKAWDGSGSEELLFRQMRGAGITLTDASLDSKFLTFYSGALDLVPLSGPDPLARKPFHLIQEEYYVSGGRFSPDGRFLAYLSDQASSEAPDVYVRPFNAEDAAARLAGVAVPVSRNGTGGGMINWRRDGRELYYLTADWEIMSVDVTTYPSFRTGTARLLFKLPGPLVGNPPQWKNVSANGERFVFAMPAEAANRTH